MKKTLLGLAALGCSVLQYVGFLVQPPQDVQARPDETTLKEMLARSNADMAVRSHHPAVDRLLVADDRVAADAGHDKTVFDKEYDKAYDRSTYDKQYSKTS
jgi:hypothetical protein